MIQGCLGMIHVCFRPVLDMFELILYYFHIYQMPPTDKVARGKGGTFGAM